jgi:regulator of protease activity HflC (stomatin/prohibitin superfamily)
LQVNTSAERLWPSGAGSIKFHRLVLALFFEEFPGREDTSMDWFLLILLVIIIAAVAAFYRQATIFEYESGLLFNRGKFQHILAPGAHGYLRGWYTIQKLDMRNRFVTLPGQEVLTADNISLRISLMASFKVGDPYEAVHETANFVEALYLLLQVNLRDVVGSQSVDDLLVKRQQIGEEVFQRSVEQAKAIGLVLLLVNVKDVMFPGEMKEIFARVVNARKEGLAALERARGETAALRNLANAAKQLKDNPELAHLRLLQALENHSGNTVVLLPGGEGLAAAQAVSKVSKTVKK